jgi:branched-subunit amino acid ABC-type transport system permease component
VLGGVIVGVGQSVGASGDLLPASVPGGGAVVTFGLLALILLIRPQGLLGKS